MQKDDDEATEEKVADENLPKIIRGPFAENANATAIENLADDNFEFAAWNRLTLKQKDLVMLEASLDPNDMKLTADERCAKVQITPGSYWKWIRLQDYIEVLEALRKPVDKARISHGLRVLIHRELNNALKNGTPLSEKRMEIYLKYTGDLISDTMVQFNQVITSQKQKNIE